MRLFKMAKDFLSHKVHPGMVWIAYAEGEKETHVNFEISFWGGVKNVKVATGRRENGVSPWILGVKDVTIVSKAPGFFKRCKICLKERWEWAKSWQQYRREVKGQKETLP